jgi:hypothetical protein
MRAIPKVTSSGLLTKQTMRKKIIIDKKYILELLLNIVTTGIEARVLGNKFL